MTDETSDSRSYSAKQTDDEVRNCIFRLKRTIKERYDFELTDQECAEVVESVTGQSADSVVKILRDS